MEEKNKIETITSKEKINNELNLYGVFVEGLYANMFYSEELAKFYIEDNCIENSTIVKLDRNDAYKLAMDDFEVAANEDLEITFSALQHNYNYIKNDIDFLILYKEIEEQVF